MKVSGRSKGGVGLRVRVVVSVFLATMVALPLSTAHAAPADPKPDLGAIRKKAVRLNNQLEKLTEQYNGLRVQLEQAKKASKSAQKDAERQGAALKKIQQKVGRLAAQRYMNGVKNGPEALFAAKDPQALLDKTATLRYFTQRDDTRIRRLTRALQTAERSKQSAQDRTTQVTKLKSQLAHKKKSIQATLEKLRKPLLKDAIDKASRGEKVPKIPGGSSKALGAVRAALSQLGVPYVWGGASPSPGFDCSGLTMWAYKQVGVNLPHYGGDQWTAGVHVKKSELRPGDLVFFYSDIHHMGMYLGNGKFVHAPHTGTVVQISELSTRPFAGAVRVV